MSDIEILPPSRARTTEMPIISTASAGEDSSRVNQEAERAHFVLRAPSRTPTKQADPSATLQERLFNSRASCKIRMADVAMHIERDWRNGFFAQVDNLLDLENWDEEDEPISAASFETLIRMILFVKPKRRPGLGATGEGNVIAAWTVGNDRLTIECMPDDEIRWVLLHYIDGDREIASGQTALPRLADVIQPYDPKKYWTANEVP